MREILAERNFPLSELRFFASARSAGSTLPWGDGEITVEDAATADPTGLDIALFSAGATTSRAQAPRFAAAGVTVIDNSSAWRRDPDVPLIVSEVNPHALAEMPQGHHRQPELHDHGRDAGAQAAARRGRAGPDRRQHLPGGLRQRASPASRSCDGQVRAVVDKADELAHDGSAVTFPEPVKYVAADRVQRAADGRLGRRRRLVRDRRGAEAPQREPQDPRHPRPAGLGHLRARAGLHRPLAVAERRVRSGRCRVERATELLSTAPGVELSDVPTPLQAAGRDPSYVGRIRQDPGVDGGRGLALFVSNDNLRKGAALNTVQIAELIAAPALIRPSSRRRGSCVSGFTCRRAKARATSTWRMVSSMTSEPWPASNR